MKIREQLRIIFKLPDETAFDQVANALSILTPELGDEVRMLMNSRFQFVKDLGGENGSARLLQDLESQLFVVIKTYEPVAQAHTGAIIENKNRLELLLHEVTAFLVSKITQLVNVPVTTLRIPTDEEKIAWNLPDPDFLPIPPPSHQAVMIQQHISDTIPFKTTRENLIVKIGIEGIFAQLIFDYLVAFDDGRFANLIITPEKIWSIDHGNCFLSQGAIRPEAMGIYENLKLADSSSILARLNHENIDQLILQLEILLGKKKVQAFAQRVATIRRVLLQNSSLDIVTLNQEINSSIYTKRRRWT